MLSVLEKGPGHGYELLQRIETRASGALTLREGSLYPALYRMEEAGLISGEWEAPSTRRGARRRIYRLTRGGKKKLGEARSAWKQFVEVIGRIVEVPA